MGKNGNIIQNNDHEYLIMIDIKVYNLNDYDIRNKDHIKKKRFNMNMENFYDNREIEGSSIHLRNKVLSILNSFSIKGNYYLDIGVGNGDFSLKISNQVNAIEKFGVDISVNAVNVTKNKGIKTSQVDLSNEKLPFSDNIFDLITCIDVIEHLTNSDNLLSESFRILKPGGYFLVSSPNIGSWISILSLILGYLPPPYEVSFKYRVGKPFGKKIDIPLAEKPIGHIKPYNLKALKEHLNAVGFEVVTVESTKLMEGKGIMRLISVIDSFFSYFKSFSGGIIILAKKR